LQALAAACRARGDAARAEQVEANLAASAKAARVYRPDPVLEAVEGLNRSSFEVTRRGHRLREGGQPEAAVQTYRRALRLNPKNVGAWAMLGATLTNLGRYDEALDALGKAAELGPNQEVSLGLGQALLEQGKDLAGAARRLDEVLAADPTHKEALLLRGAVEVRQGRWEPALARFRAVRERASADLFAVLGEARCLVALKRGAEARQCLEQAARLRPADLNLQAALARLLAACPDGAARDGKRAVELARPVFEKAATPAHAEVLAMASAEAGRFDEAVRQQAWALERVAGKVAADVQQRLTENLERYRRREPCRDPWPASEPFPPRRSALTAVVAKANAPP
jgi:cytochrome c-type biogenesis protein CcmH/NrfG